MSDRKITKDELRKMCESCGIEINQCLRDIDKINMEIISAKLSQKEILKLSSIMSKAEDVIKEQGIIANETTY